LEDSISDLLKEIEAFKNELECKYGSADKSSSITVWLNRKLFDQLKSILMTDKTISEKTGEIDRLLESIDLNNIPNSDEITMILFYTMDTPFYRILNKEMRNQKESSENIFEPVVKILLSGLSKLPRYEVFYLVHFIPRLGGQKPGKKLFWKLIFSLEKLIVVREKIGYF
jgi:hypothetical protein